MLLDFTRPIMPTGSLYPPVEVPEIDLWECIFERKDRPFPDDKGKADAAWDLQLLNMNSALH